MSNITNQNINKICNYSYGNLFEKLSITKDFIKNEFIHGGHLAALSVSTIALSAILLFNLSIKWDFLLIVYLLTLCVYCYDYHKGLKMETINNQYRSNHLKKYSKCFPIILLFYVTAFITVLLYFGNLGSLIFGGLLLIAGVLYTYKFKKITRKIIGFKNYYTSFSISSLAIFASIYYGTQVIAWVLLLIFILLFLRLMINTSFCDIKDINVDKKNNLLTLPIVLGKEKLISYLHIINIISIIPIFIGIYLKLLPLFSLFLLATTFYSSYYLLKTKNKTINIQSISSTLVDGEFIIWPFLLILGKSVMTIL